MEFGQTREYSEEVAARIDREVSRMLEQAYDRAKDILRQNKDKLDMLVEALMAQETLNRAEFTALMDEGKMPDGSDQDKPRLLNQILEKKQQPEEKASEEEQKENGETEERSELEGYHPAPEKDDTEYLND